MTQRKGRRDRTLGATAVSGMTLIEVLAVLAILSLAAVMAVPLVRAPSPERTLQTAADNLARQVRAARSTAILTNGETRLLIDVDARTIATRTGDARVAGLLNANTPVRVAGGQPVQLPSGMTVTVTAAAADVEPGRVAAIRFFPDGSSTGGRIELRLRERRAVVAVDWLSGRVTRLGAATLGRAP